jgi:hypothetical protein
LVIEGGQDNFEQSNVVNPGLFREHLRPGSKTAIFYKAKATPQMGDKERVVPAGGLLGGGSSINLMLYAAIRPIYIPMFGLILGLDTLELSGAISTPGTPRAGVRMN